MFSAKIIALIAAFSATALANDVHAQFYDASKDEVGGGTTFDVVNGGCSNLIGAEYVSFSQSGTQQTANRPYCLTGYSDQCVASTGKEQFADVELSDRKQYALNSDVAGASAFS